MNYYRKTTKGLAVMYLRGKPVIICFTSIWSCCLQIRIISGSIRCQINSPIKPINYFNDIWRSLVVRCIPGVRFTNSRMLFWILTNSRTIFTNHERNRFHEFTNDFFHFHEFTNEKKPIPACTNTAGGPHWAFQRCLGSETPARFLCTRIVVLSLIFSAKENRIRNIHFLLSYGLAKLANLTRFQKRKFELRRRAASLTTSYGAKNQISARCNVLKLDAELKNGRLKVQKLS